MIIFCKANVMSLLPVLLALVRALCNQRALKKRKKKERKNSLAFLVHASTSFVFPATVSVKLSGDCVFVCVCACAHACMHMRVMHAWIE